MKLFGNPLQSVNPQVKTIGNTAITKEGTEKVILAEFQTSSENRRVTKIKCYYDESIAEIDNLSISMHLKSETIYLLLDTPLYLIGNKKNSTQGFEKILWCAESEKDSLLTSPTCSVIIECISPIPLPPDKIFFYFESFKILGEK